jgi:hypothetical protein
MTRARWIVGGLVSAAALIVAGKAFFAYVAVGSIVGVAAVLVLLGVLGVGLWSLARARRDVGRELAALATTPPSGALWASRRAQALELQSRGVAPDLDVLAEATAAEEAERGFAGKYLVATTILVGLVGTFGGLMETLARVAPLFKDPLAAEGPAGVLALLAGPLAGLHVTFGTSVVAILVTLALALVQGDVTLHHERLLARLQERTRHVLVPELWPAHEGAAERAARALDELRALVAASAASSAEAVASSVAEIARVELARLADAVGEKMTAAATATREAMTAAAAETRDAMTGAATATKDAMTGAAAAMREATTGAATATKEAMTDAAAALGTSTAASAAALREEAERSLAGAAASVAALLAEARRQQGEAADGLARAAATLGEASASMVAGAEGAATAMTATAERSARALSEAAGAALGGLTELRVGVGGELVAAAQALAASTGELRAAAADISPALATLAPQLGALAREVALLAAQAEDPESGNAVLDALVHLGEDVERLVALAQPTAGESAGP